MENLRETINTGLSKAIQEDHDTEDVNILYDLVMGSTTPAFAAVDLVALANRTSGDQAFLLDISIQILSLACDYPFLQPALVDLVASLSRPSPSSPTSPTRYDFVSSFATMTGDLTRANYGHLFDAASSTSTTGLIQDHVNLNGFIARLLSTVDSPEDPKDRVTGLDDALFIMSTSLEDHPNSHSLPDVDIPAAAQYMIHAGALLLKACQDRWVGHLHDPKGTTRADCCD